MAREPEYISLEELRRLALEVGDKFENRYAAIKTAKTARDILEALFWNGESSGARNAMID